MNKKIKPPHDLLHHRILMVEIDNTTVGLLADRISNVSHLPNDIIDATPAVISSYEQENKGIAKSNTGTRMILLVDETLIRSSGEMAAFFQIQEKQSETKTPKSDFASPFADFICIKQGACGIGMAHGNRFLKLKYRINCRYAATCLSSPSLPLHFNISMGAPQGSPCPP